MRCICQLVYNTGFSGIRKLDARLSHHYTVYGEDCIRRSFDHHVHRIPYSDTPRNPYCFERKTKGRCEHDRCDHARYREPDTVKKMRYYIENVACQASVHYPDFLDDSREAPQIPASGGRAFKTGGEERKYGTPDFLRRKTILGYYSADGVAHAEGITALQSEYLYPNEAAIAEREAWEDEMHRLHRSIGFAYRAKEPGPHAPEERYHKRNVVVLHDPNEQWWAAEQVPYERKTLKADAIRLPVQSIEDFRQHVAETLYGVDSMERGEHDEDEYIAGVERAADLTLSRYLGEDYDEALASEIISAYDVVID